MPKEWKQIIADEGLTDEQIAERLSTYSSLVTKVEELTTQIQELTPKVGDPPAAESTPAAPKEGQTAETTPAVLEELVKRLAALESTLKKSEGKPPITPEPKPKKDYEIPRPKYESKAWESHRKNRK